MIFVAYKYPDGIWGWSIDWHSSPGASSSQAFLQSELFHGLFSAAQTGKRSSYRGSTGEAFI